MKGKYNRALMIGSLTNLVVYGCNKMTKELIDKIHYVEIRYYDTYADEEDCKNLIWDDWVEWKDATDS